MSLINKIKKLIVKKHTYSFEFKFPAEQYKNYKKNDFYKVNITYDFIEKKMLRITFTEIKKVKK